MLRPRTDLKITYFAQFLTQISDIITNIKQYVYQIIDIPLPLTKIQTINQSMSSVVVFTHKTFDDLKKIESMISGYVKAKKIKKTDLSLNFTMETTSRSKSSSSSHIFYSSKHQTKSNLKNKQSIFLESKQFIDENCSGLQKKKGKNQGILKLNKQSATSRTNLSDQSQEIIQNLKEQQQQILQMKQYNLSDLKDEIQQKLKQLNKFNRENLQKILARNKKCNDLLEQVKLLIKTS